MGVPVTGYTKLFGVIADPIKHSISPTIHNAAFSALDIDAVYLAFEVNPSEFDKAIQSFKTFEMGGANLSMPFKQVAMDYMDELTPSAKLIGAMNTIIPQDGKLIGHNTDGIGFMRSLDDLNWNIIAEKITVIGGGGAATAIIAQAMLDGVKEISVFNRKSAHYAEIATTLEQFSKKTGVVAHLYDLADTRKLQTELQESVLLVNTTNVGMAPNTDVSPIQDASIIPSEINVYDIIYNPKETMLLTQAKTQGARVANGLGMLLYQAAESFEKWTGQKMPIDIVKQTLEEI
jgi:shikimate dehydrogenase